MLTKYLTDISDCCYGVYFVLYIVLFWLFRAFEFQVQMSIVLKKPLMLFYRDAFYDFIMMLSKNKYMNRLKGGLVHSFAGTALESRELIRKGYYIGVSGW